MVVDLPPAADGGGRVPVREGVASPELLVVDSMAALDLASAGSRPLPRPARSPASPLPAVTLQPTDAKGNARRRSARNARLDRWPSRDGAGGGSGSACNRSGRCMEGPNARSASRTSRRPGRNCPVRPLKELQLARHPLVRAAQARQAQVPKHSLDGAHGQASLVNPLEPQAEPRRPIAELTPNVPNQRKQLLRSEPVGTPAGIGRHQSGHAALAPAVPPATDRRGADAWYRWPPDALNPPEYPGGLCARGSRRRTKQFSTPAAAGSGRARTS